ncbi:MAG TPA: hypothetical protein VHD63_08065 [Ktedonobacteraceae bacterium]|nr:hypothetical protein [Ktedonobacteraceae bacterium]
MASNQAPFRHKTVEGSITPVSYNIWQRLGRAWLRFSGPDPSRFSATLEDQERLRRARVLSGILPLALVAIFLIFPTAIAIPINWLPLAAIFVFALIAFLCNRVALINLGGFFTILAVDVTLVILMIALPTGIRNSNIPDFDLFLIATLIGGIVLPRRVLPFLTIFHLGLIIALFALLPHDPLLEKEIQINDRGLAYNEISDALLLQIAGSILAWINARSVDIALQRASRAEELAETQRHLHEQTQMQVQRKERLEYGIEVLKEAHARFANGDYRARAMLQDNELASLAISFNLLADRVNRIARVAGEHERLEKAFHQLFAIQDDVIYRGQLRPLPPTGTLVDRIYPWLRQYYLFRQVYTRCGTVLEKARFALTRQRTVLTQLRVALDQIHKELHLVSLNPRAPTAALELVEKARDLCSQVDEQGKSGLHETKQLDQMLKV